MGLVTLDTAREHLNVTHSDDDLKITRMIDDATDIILDYLGLDAGTYQTTALEPDDDSLPPRVRAATLLVLGSLYDNADGQNPDKPPLSEAVKDLLRRSRDPALA